MSKQLKLTISFTLALVVGLVAVFYFVSQKIDAESLKKNLVAEIERSIPGSQATIGQVDYSIGLRAKILMNKIIVKNARKEDLLDIEKAEVEVPVFDILKGGGRLEVKIQRPTMFLRTTSDNLPDLRETIGEKGLQEPKKEAPSKSISAPSFVNRSRWDLNIEDLSLNIVGKPDEERKTYLIKKAIFKNLNLEKTTAFEIVSKIDHVFSDERKISTEAQAVGEVNIAQILEGNLNINMLVNTEKTVLSWTNAEIPPLKNVIKLTGSASSSYELNLRSSGSNTVNLETEVTFSKGCCAKVSVNKLESSFSLKSLVNFLPSTHQKKLKNINWGDSKAVINGSLLYESGETFRPSIEFSLDRPITLKDSVASHSISIDGHFVGDHLSAKLTDEVLDGVVTLDASTSYSPLSDFNSIVEGKLLLTSLKIDKDLIQGLVYKKSEEKSPAIKGAAEKSKEGAKESKNDFAPFDFIVEGKHIYINDQELNISGKLKNAKNKVTSENLKISFGSGELGIKLMYKSGALLNASLNLKNADMKALNSFLPPFVSNLEGTFDGEIEGQFNLGSSRSYIIEAEVFGREGSLGGLDLSTVFVPVLQKIPNVKAVDSQALKNAKNFKSFKVKGKFTEATSQVENLELRSSSGSVGLVAKGNVHNSPEEESAVKAVMFGQFLKYEPTRATKERLHFLLTGKGVRIRPQLQYTLDMMKKSKDKITQ